MLWLLIFVIFYVGWKVCSSNDILTEQILQLRVELANRERRAIHGPKGECLPGSLFYDKNNEVRASHSHA
jgi:hypothetical protein